MMQRNDKNIKDEDLIREAEAAKTQDKLGILLRSSRIDAMLQKEAKFKGYEDSLEFLKEYYKFKSSVESKKGFLGDQRKGKQEFEALYKTYILDAYDADNLTAQNKTVNITGTLQKECAENFKSYNKNKALEALDKVAAQVSYLIFTNSDLTQRASFEKLKMALADQKTASVDKQKSSFLSRFQKSIYHLRPKYDDRTKNPPHPGQSKSKTSIKPSDLGVDSQPKPEENKSKSQRIGRR